jgi:hypothetical protein
MSGKGGQSWPYIRIVPLHIAGNAPPGDRRNGRLRVRAQTSRELRATM